MLEDRIDGSSTHNNAPPVSQSAPVSHPVLDDLADPSRRAILEELRSGAKAVMELVERTGLKQPNVSNHLAKMRDRGIVLSQRSGRNIYYQLANPLIETVLATALAAPSADARETPTEAHLEQWAKRYFQALVTADQTAARHIVNECLAHHVSLLDIYVGIFQPALHQIGEWYMLGQLTEAQEHLATSLTERMMARVSQFYPLSVPNGRRAVLGSVSGNWHTIALRMISDFLQHRGWQTLYLGADVPSPSFVQMVRQEKPHVIFVSCMVEENAPVVRQLFHDLRQLREQENQHFALCVGGLYVNLHPDFVHEVGADFTAPHLRALESELSKALTRRGSNAE